MFLIHGDLLFQWTEFFEQYPQTNVVLEQISTIHSMMRLEDDSNFYFIQNTFDIDNKEQIIKQEIKKVTAGFTFCNSYTVYKNTSKNIIKSMNMDTNTKKIIILKKMWNEDEEKLIDS